MSISAPVTVVGYDGSPPSDRALEHAVVHIGGGSLCIVHAWQPPRRLRSSPVAAAASLERAQRLMEALPARHPRLAEVAWVGHVAEAPPVEAIGDAVRRTEAAQVVVGTHGYARLRSTAHGLLHDAPCPVTVVPERPPLPDPSRGEHWIGGFPADGRGVATDVRVRRRRNARLTTERSTPW